MPHVRQQIREAAAAAVSGLPITGANVYQSRIYSHDVLPCISIYTRDEDAEYTTVSRPRASRRELQLTVEVRAQQLADVDDQLDQISAEVEAALAADVTLGGLAKDTQYQGIDIELSGEGEQPTALASMNFLVIYRVLETDAQTTA